MPEVSRFLGIVIRMYYRDHAPPHFHAEYGEYEITVEIGSELSRAAFHDELWQQCSNGTPSMKTNWLKTGSLLDRSNP